MKHTFCPTTLSLLFCFVVLGGGVATAATGSVSKNAGNSGNKFVVPGMAAPPPVALERANGNLSLAASAYINFGAKDGSSSYGFRDNAGTIQIKNANGSWADIATGTDRHVKHARGRDDGKLISPAIKAVREQQAEIKKQQAEIDQLRAEVELLCHRGASGLPESSP